MLQPISGIGDRQLIIGQDVRPLLRLAPARSDHHEDFGDAELPGGEYPGVALEHVANALAEQVDCDVVRVIAAPETAPVAMAAPISLKTQGRAFHPALQLNGSSARTAAH
jgi:hypothetical protein